MKPVAASSSPAGGIPLAAALRGRFRRPPLAPSALDGICV
jgi:hypothetical protein